MVQRSLEAAERNEYRRVRRIGPRNDPVESVSERVLGAERLAESLLDAGHRQAMPGLSR